MPKDLAKGVGLGAYLTWRSDVNTVHQTRENIEASMGWFLTRTIYEIKGLALPYLIEEIDHEVEVEALREVNSITYRQDGAMAMTGAHGKKGKDAEALAPRTMNRSLVAHRDGGEGAQLWSIIHPMQTCNTFSCTCTINFLARVAHSLHLAPLANHIA